MVGVVTLGDLGNYRHLLLWYRDRREWLRQQRLVELSFAEEERSKADSFDLAERPCLLHPSRGDVSLAHDRQSISINPVGHHSSYRVSSGLCFA